MYKGYLNTKGSLKGLKTVSKHNEFIRAKGFLNGLKYMICQMFYQIQDVSHSP